MKKKFSFLCILLYCITCNAIEYAPWFDETYTLKVKPSWAYATFNQLALDNSKVNYNSCDNFYSFNLLGFPLDRWSVELEFEAFQTSIHSFNFEYGRLCARRLILDDITGEDPLSMALGLTLTSPTKCALSDLSTFHHWYFDSEVHVTVGKERACNGLWSDRGWILLGIGCGNRGSPWLHGLGVLEKNFCDEHQLRFYAEYLCGLGNDNITDPNEFFGYATIAHRSLDFGVGYSYEWFPYAKFNLDYNQRAYARNFPYNRKSVIVSIWFPISF